LVLGKRLLQVDIPPLLYSGSSFRPFLFTDDVQGGTFTEPLRRDATTGGIALKITKTDDGLYTGAPTQIFSYSLDGAKVWYDLSTVFGEPFKGQRVTVESPGGGTISWPAGTNPGGSQVKDASSNGDVVFTAYAAA
jgi:hypothetical protein